MPWPDFTELSFGYCFLREFENRYVSGGAFPKAPDFISQYDEATEGYDVELAIDGATPVFLQFKRSFVLTTRNAKEIQDGHYVDPKIYRMNLHKSGAYRQHKALQKLESAGSDVYYVTSQIHTTTEFTSAYTAGHIVSGGTAVFSPSEIVLPDFTRDHHVSFRTSDNFGYVYSSEARQFERRFRETDKWLSVMLAQPRTRQENRKHLKNVVEQLRSDLGLRSPLRKILDGKDDPVLQASILAYFLLDAHLTFAKAAPDKSI